MRYAACVEYDGTLFSGWQTQVHGVRTVQSAVEQALSKVADEPISVIAAGRTDTGVHATHQVIHFDAHAYRSEFAWTRGANRFLAKDVRLIWVQQIEDNFHARFSAQSRSYRFIINNTSIVSALFRHYSSHEYRQLDCARMAKAGQSLLGEHDFSSFRAAACQAHSPIRNVIEFELNSTGSWVWFDITANAFLQHMVRNIAGALIEVGCGKRELDWLKFLLEQKDRTKGSITAPPNGLYLVGVNYSSTFALQSNYRPVNFW